MTTKPISIGYYDDGEHRAGTGRYLCEIIGSLDRSRYRPVFFAPRSRAWHHDLRELDVQIVYPEGAEPEPLLKLVDTTEPIAETRKMKYRPRLPAPLAFALGTGLEIRNLRRLFAREPVALLHSNNTGAEPAPIAARMAGIPHVLGTFHVLPSYDLDGLRNGRRYRLLESASMKALHHAIACCDAARKDWQARIGFEASHCTVIYNGIDTERVARQATQEEARRDLGLRPDALVIAAVGMLHRYKGFNYLLQALPDVVKRFPDVQVVIAGTGPQEDELQRKATRLGVSDSVHWLGFCSNVRTLLEAADMYVQPSLVEACPMAILEAGAMGLPVVASAVGGIPEMVQEGRTGLLVPPQEPNPLAHALNTLLGNPELRAAMGEAGRQRIYEFFTRDRMVSETLGIYEKMLHPSQSSVTGRKEKRDARSHSDADRPEPKSRISA